ncbi:hypothetical protein FRC12_024451 [Ceratobasidium sp. 428]|nr:hypothetical protein FRC12_024451 [Ceratobasidium sp. 428]
MPLFETSYIPSQGRLTPLQKPLLFDLTFRNAIISTMLVALIPLLMLAASLHESLFDSLGYQSAAGVSGMISYFFAGSTVSQFYHGTVTFVELRVNACEIKSLSFTSYYRPSLRLDDDSLSFLNRSITASHSGLGEQSAVSGQHMTASYKLEPTRPSAAAAPVQGWGARQRIEGCPTHVPLATPALVPAPNVETPESGVIVPLLLTMGVDSTTLAPSLAVLPPTPIAASLDVLVPTPLPTVTPASQQALSSLLATHPSGELAFNTSPNSIILVHVIRVDPLVGGIVSKLPFPAPAHDFKPEEYTVATSHVVVATSIVISTSAPSTPPHQPTVVPVLTKHEQVDSSWTWMSRYGWVLIWTVPLALQVGIAVGLYLNQRRPVQCCRQGFSTSSTRITHAHNLVRIADVEVSDVLKILRLLKELEDLPHIIDEYDITPGELRSYIDMIVETRQSASGQSAVESSAGQSIPASPCNRNPRQDSSPAPSLSTRTNDSFAAVFARAAALQKGIVDQGERFERRFDEIWAVIGSPRREESRREDSRREESRREELSEEELSEEELGEGEMPAAGASDSVERRKTDMRALANVSPLAHRTLKRTGGRMTNGALPTPEPSHGRTWTQTTEPGAGGHRTEATNDLENTRSASFNPVAASSPVRATRGTGRNGASEGLDVRSMSFTPIGTSSPVRAQGSRTSAYNQSTSHQVRQISNPHEGMSPDSTGTLSPPGDGPSLSVREPLPRITSAYVSFGTLAEMHLPARPQAPEPDTTLDSLAEESGEE